MASEPFQHFSYSVCVQQESLMYLLKCFVPVHELVPAASYKLSRASGF